MKASETEVGKRYCVIEHGIITRVASLRGGHSFVLNDVCSWCRQSGYGQHDEICPTPGVILFVTDNFRLVELRPGENVLK